MSDYIPLTCPSCGAIIERQKKSGKFVCDYCGQVHMLYIDGHHIPYIPSVGDLRNIETIESQTGENVVANSAYIELENLVKRKDRLLLYNPQPDASVITVLAIGVIIVLIGLFLLRSYIEGGLILILIGGILAYFSYDGSCQYDKDITYWEAEILPQVNELDRWIASKRSEIEKIEGNNS